MAGVTWADLSPAWRAAFEEAWSAYCAGSLPIGACVADPAGVVVARGRNRLAEARAVDGFVAGHNLGHAEVNALLALPELARPESYAHTLYTTVEPCPQCAGALGMSSLRGLNYAAPDAWSGCARLLTDDPYLGRKGFRVTRVPKALQRICLVLLLAAVYQDERTLSPASPYRAALQAAQPEALALAQDLFTLGVLPGWRSEGRSTAAVYADLINAGGVSGLFNTASFN